MSEKSPNQPLPSLEGFNLACPEAKFVAANMGRAMMIVLGLSAPSPGLENDLETVLKRLENDFGDGEIC